MKISKVQFTLAFLTAISSTSHALDVSSSLKEYPGETKLMEFNADKLRRLTVNESGQGQLGLRLNKTLEMVLLQNGKQGLKISDSCLIATSLMGDQRDLKAASLSAKSFSIHAMTSNGEALFADQRPGTVFALLKTEKDSNTYLNLYCHGFQKTREEITLADVNEKLGAAAKLYAMQMVGSDPNKDMNLDELVKTDVMKYVVVNKDLKMIGFRDPNNSRAVKAQKLSLKARPVYAKNGTCFLDLSVQNEHAENSQTLAVPITGGSVYEISYRSDLGYNDLQHLQLKKKSGSGPENLVLNCNEANRISVTELELQLMGALDFTDQVIEPAQLKSSGVISNFLKKIGL